MVGLGGCAGCCLLLHVLRSAECRYESGASRGSVTGVSVVPCGVFVCGGYQITCMSGPGLHTILAACLEQASDPAASDLVFCHAACRGPGLHVTPLGVTACHVSAAGIISTAWATAERRQAAELFRMSRLEDRR